MEIPYTELSADALRGVIEEFVSREGTDYGAAEYSFDEKIEQVKRQLKSGEIKLFFDAESETCNLVRDS
jgi:uncharacterized protein